MFSKKKLKNLRKIKAKMLCVPLNYEGTMKNMREDVIDEERRYYKMPDKSCIVIPKEPRLNAAELLFKSIA